MLNMKQVLASVAVAAMLATGVAVAQMPKLGGGPAAPTGDVQVQVLTNTAKGYQIGYPSGWQVVSGDGIDYAFIAPDNSAMCMANSGAVPDLASVPEDQLKAAMSQDLGEKFWDNSFFEGMANKKYLHTGANPNHPGGWPVQEVEAQGDLDLDGKPLPATFAGIMTFKAATAYQIMCFAPTALYEQSKPSFSTVLNSFRSTK